MKPYLIEFEKKKAKHREYCAKYKKTVKGEKCYIRWKTSIKYKNRKQSIKLKKYRKTEKYREWYDNFLTTDKYKNKIRSEEYKLYQKYYKEISRKFCDEHGISMNQLNKWGRLFLKEYEVFLEIISLQNKIKNLLK